MLFVVCPHFPLDTHADKILCVAAAKNALRKKKTLEHQLEQTSAQMLTLEREISSIETANINKETLDAMKSASAAMKQIHGGLTIDKVDATMYATTPLSFSSAGRHRYHTRQTLTRAVRREDLRDQHAIGEEIAEALTQGAVTAGAMDDDELEDELAELQQEELDNKMIKSGTIPVHDQVQRLPAVGAGERKCPPSGRRKPSCASLNMAVMLQ